VVFRSMRLRDMPQAVLQVSLADGRADAAQ
jgi:hypothetical protein